MSGGSYNYAYATVRDEYCGQMHDKELDSMITDLIEVLHDLEWWQSADTSEAKYRKSCKDFKAKWFGSRDERLKEIVAASCDDLKAELIMLIGAEQEGLK